MSKLFLRKPVCDGGLARHNAPNLKFVPPPWNPNPSFQRKLESSGFEAEKALDSSFRWNDEQQLPEAENL